MTTTDFNKIRAGFMQRASAPNIPHAAFKLAWLIAYRYMNRESGTARPAQETLARDLNVSVRTVQRLLDILERHGLVIVPGDGRGHASSYCLDPERATRASSFHTENTTPVSPFTEPKRVTSDDRKGDSRDKKGCHRCRPNLNKKNQEEEPRGSKRASHARARPPDSASRKADKRTSDEGSKNRAAIAAGFARFMRAYPRKINEDDARAAFGKAIDAGADIETVVARAAVYAVERAAAIQNGDNPKWTPYPATWLKKRKWNDPLPPGLVLDQDGIVVAIEQPRQAINSWDELADKLIAEHEVKQHEITVFGETIRWEW